jgi:hypothetical protein
MPPSEAELTAISGDDRVHLFVARSADGVIQGAVALVFYRAQTGLRARIEDLVVSQSQRGLGLGKAPSAAGDAGRAGGASAYARPDFERLPPRSECPVRSSWLPALGDQRLPQSACRTGAGNLGGGLGSGAASLFWYDGVKAAPEDPARPFAGRSFVDSRWAR